MPNVSSIYQLQIKRLSAVKLYREDFEQLKSIITPHLEDVIIITGTHRFDSWEDFLNHAPPKVAQVQIASGIVEGQPFVKINIMPTYVTIDSESIKKDIRLQRHVFDDIVQVLESRVIKRNYTYFFYFLITLCITSSAAVFFLPLNRLLVSISIGLWSMQLVGNLINIFQVRSSLSMESEENHSSFWERKKDDLLMNSIIALFAALIGFVIAKYLDK